MGGTTAPTSRRLRARLIAAVTGAAGLAALIAAAAPDPASPADPPLEKHEVLLVGNNWDGTVDMFNQYTFQKVGQMNVAPDFHGCDSTTPPQAAACELNNEFAAEGNPQLVDDLHASPDGRVIYVSRPSMGDVAAFDIITKQQLWKTSVSGFRSDHMEISPDGSEVIVSATIGNVVQVLNAQTGAIIDSFPTGDFPHENNYSHDGQLIFNGSIGRVITPDDPALDALKGNRIFTIADATTHDVIKTINFGVAGEVPGITPAGVRPFHVLEDNRTMYVQLSFFNGLVEYDLDTEQELRRLDFGAPPGLPRSEYPLDSAHHGIAINGDESKICNAATVSDYVAIIDRASFTVDGYVPTGDIPYWATTSGDGQYCFVSNSGTDDISVISYSQAREIARIPVGDHPQRARVYDVLLPVGEYQPVSGVAARTCKKGKRAKKRSAKKRSAKVAKKKKKRCKRKKGRK